MVIVLPEVFDLGWTHPAALTSSAIPDGDTCRLLSQAARGMGFTCVPDSRAHRNGLATTRPVIVDPTGQVILHHRKLNELDIAHDLYAQGTG
jgi:predicted amidohydrolase